MASSVPASPLNQCYHCNKEFHLPPNFGHDLVTTVCCYKILHSTCLTDWVVTRKKETCTCCTQFINRTQAGKPIGAIWTVFKIAISQHPKDVCTVFNGERLKPTKDSQPFSPDKDCPTCSEEYPDLGICYLPSAQRFSHTQCAPSLEGYQVIHLSNLAWLTKELVSKHPDLAQKFSPKRHHDVHYTPLKSMCRVS